MRDGSLIKYEDQKDFEETDDDVKSLLATPKQTNSSENDRAFYCNDDGTPTRNDDTTVGKDDDKTPVSRSNGRVSPVQDQVVGLPLKNRRISEKDQERIKTAVDTLQSGELIADGSRVSKLRNSAH